MRWASKPAAILGWALTAAATYAALFVIPFRFPLREPVLSDTWAAGANNQAAAVALACVSVAVTLVCWYRGGNATPHETESRLSPAYLFAAIALATLWTAALGWAVSRTHMYWGDEGYFLNRLQTGLVFHRAIYTQFEFAYGPLLYLWPAAFIRGLAPLGIGFTAAYLVSLAVMQATGLALLFYTVQALPLGRPVKALAFVFLSLGALNSLLGLNYSVFRFVLPFACVVYLSRRRTPTQAAVTAGIAEILCLATSPELGVAFGGAAVAFALYRGVRDGIVWIVPALAAAAGAAAFAGFAGRGYFLTLGEMAKGGFNVLLVPSPHILALAVAAAALAPLAVARSLRNTGDGMLILPMYVAALGLLPAALGRADAIHVFADALGMVLLSLVALNALSACWQRFWIAAAVVLCAFTLAANVGGSRLRLLLHPEALQDDWGFDEAALRNAIGGATISAPGLAPQRVIDDLARTGQYLPDYFCGWVGVWDREAEAHKIADMRRAEFALVALRDPAMAEPARDQAIQSAMRLGLATHPRRPDYTRGVLFDAELQSHWIAIQRFGDFQLYQRRF